MTNKELGKIIGSVHKRLVDVETSSKRIDPIADLQPVDPELEHTMQIGKLTHDYEWKKMIYKEIQKKQKQVDPEKFTCGLSRTTLGK